MSKHTPGPWGYHWYEKNQRTHVGEFGFTEETRGYSFPLTLGGKKDSGYAKTAEANARLMAAAPNLLETLTYIVDQAHMATTLTSNGAARLAALYSIEAVARVAIAKATEEQV